MKKPLKLLLLLAIISQSGFTQILNKDEAIEKREERMKWWAEARFGMFIHWGISAEAARGEWVQTTEEMTNEEYHKYFEIFEPDLYDPREWAQAAKSAGMKYVVITTKHHDGFCLWDSEYTDFKSTNTPYGKDLLKPFVEAFREEGLRVGFYYSGPDWNHPKYPINHGRLIHPLRNHPDRETLDKDRDLGNYIEFMHNQLRELLTDFGQIDLFWSDYGGDVTTERDELLNLIRGQQPQIIVNDRLFRPRYLSGLGWDWDYRSPEQTMPGEKGIIMEGQGVPWEICHTLDGSWGYRRNVAITNRYGWKTSKQLIGLLIESVSKGGNLLLNVGPTARGKFSDNTMDRLSSIGDWMEYHSRAIYGCTAAPQGFKAPDNTLLTYNPETNRLYIHILEWPTRLLHLDEFFTGKVKHARFLHDASEIQFTEGMGFWDFVWTGDTEDVSTRETLETLTLQLDIVKPDTEIPVIELILK
jgi:alpha-L-fucosidase